MGIKLKILLVLTGCLYIPVVFSSNDLSLYYQQVETYVNPVLSGDHPDPSLLKVGDDFYASGSSFHFTPYAPIMHSKDLVHWEIISRVVSPFWSELRSDAPGAGLWGGTLAYFYASYWYYFSNTAGGGQYFCKATSPQGPWSAPVKVTTTPETGAIGYDNSIFVDEDGTPYMLIKAGQFINRIQRIGKDGHLTGSVINLDWVNTGKKYSWAEGPVMCKRKGWYYYFIAGNVYGGQYVLRSKTLTSDSLSWEALGNFFEPITDPTVRFRSPNHITQPFMLNDSTWWTISHSYEQLNNNSWEGRGRQGLLHQVVWDTNGKPTGKAPTTAPVIKPLLTNQEISWKLPRSDYFDQSSLSLSWHFLNRSAASKYSLAGKTGWLALLPGADSCHLLQKEAGHYYAMVTRLAFHATHAGQAAGLYLTNGNMTKLVKLVSGYDNGNQLTFSFMGTVYQVNNALGDTVWLKIERQEHNLFGFYSSDGMDWHSIGEAIDVHELDKSQDNYNSWVGNCQGLYAKGGTAYFDCFYYRDGFSLLPVAGSENYYGIEKVTGSTGTAITNTSSYGGWFMMGGIEMGRSASPATHVEIEASSTLGGVLEIWLDDLERGGTKLGEMAIPATGGLDHWLTCKAAISEATGQHDVYFRFQGPKNAFYIRNIQFKPTAINPLNSIKKFPVIIYPNPTSNTFNVTVEGEQDSIAYHVYNLTGRLMEKGVIHQTETIGEKWENGCYVISLLVGEQIESFTLSKL